MTKIRFEPTDEGGLESARTIVLERLRIDKEWKHMETTAVNCFTSPNLTDSKT